jgi:hypothetical protein
VQVTRALAREQVGVAASLVFLWGLTHHARVRMYHCSACGFASAYAAGTDVDRLHNPVSFCRDVRIGIWVVVRSVDVRYAPVLVQYQ